MILLLVAGVGMGATLSSGAFAVTVGAQYIEATEQYQIEVGNLQWAAPQDWMCEPWIVAKTGLTVEYHQWHGRYKAREAL